MLFWQLNNLQLIEILYEPYAMAIVIQLKLGDSDYSDLLTAEKR